MRRVLGISILLLATVAGCKDQETLLERDPLSPAFSALDPDCTPSPDDVAPLGERWKIGSVSGVSTGTVSNAASIAVGSLASGFPYPWRLPTQDEVYGTRTVDVVVYDSAGQPDVWTGSYSNDMITICNWTNCTLGNQQWGTMSSVLRHEFSHVIGLANYTSGSETRCLSDPRGVDDGTNYLQDSERNLIHTYYDDPPTNVMRTPAPDTTLYVGQTVSLSATAVFSNGSTSNLSEFTWYSTNGSIVVAGPGTATGAGIGVASIVAEDVQDDSKSATWTFTVYQPRSVTINGTGLITVKQNYTYSASLSGFAAPASYAWQYRQCDGVGTSCGAWQNEGSGTTMVDQLSPAPNCVATPQANYEIVVSVTDSPDGHADGFKRVWRCMQ